MEIKLSELANGGLQERFENEMGNVLENIADRNTDASVKRSVTIKLTFKPNEKRDIADTIIDVSSKLAPAVSVPTSIVMGHDEKGKVVGQELKSGLKGQTYFDGEAVNTDTGEKIFDFRKTK
ncbi:hypothetical protein [Sediminibacillus halophilus]|uniref:Replication terminator protein n=1 Tax=Sediminibacillus halophilus TaxID=482461 RepID=A0A1G9QWX0_9BACI|nr:hypothetical protein [Sediminibacillus halophilus]SDM15509.1 hypothetical protein SAMN05216244_1709 [Sediminibacillus halophilus]